VVINGSLVEIEGSLADGMQRGSAAHHTAVCRLFVPQHVSLDTGLFRGDRSLFRGDRGLFSGDKGLGGGWNATR